MIEKLRKRPVEVETILWEGTKRSAADIQSWTGLRPGSEEHAFLCQVGSDAPQGAARGWLRVAHNNNWCNLPVGYRVARELDGSGFYPLSPEGAAAGYEMPGGAE